MRNGIADPCGSSARSKFMHLVVLLYVQRGAEMKNTKQNNNQSGVEKKTRTAFSILQHNANPQRA